MPSRAEKFRQDWEVRIAAIRWILELCEKQQSDGVLYRRLYERQQFFWEGESVLLQDQQRGVTNPRQCQLPISITTTSRFNHHGDHFEPDGEVFRYSYQGNRDASGRLTDIDNAYNRGLRELMRLRWPLIYFHGVYSAHYLVVAPVMIVDDDPISQTFGVIWGERLDFYRELQFPGARVQPAAGDQDLVLDIPDLETESIQQRSVKVRLAQGSFRAKILKAYKNSCALCRLQHPPLLDAAHIIPVSDKGNYSVPNGLSLCKLHHAAYDENYLGITPDFKIKVRVDLLEERDGPVLQHAIKGMHDEAMRLPSQRDSRPDRDALARRYEEFRQGQNAL